MINLSKKLYISLFTLILMVIVTGTATFAWLKLNPNAWFDEMQIDVSSNEDVEISVDGVRWTHNLSKQDVMLGIISKGYGYEIKNELKQDDTYHTYLFDPETEESFETTDLENLFSSLKLKPVTTTDGKNFTNLIQGAVPIKAKHYFQIDIYFRSEADQTVFFSNREIVYDDGTVIPKTEIGIKDKASADLSLLDPNDNTKWANTIGSFDTYNRLTGEKVHYSALERTPIEGYTAYASDALRFGITVNNAGSVETPKIYELNKGMGSYATTLDENLYVGTTGAAYDSTKNGAFTYYNNVKQHELDANGNPATIEAIDYSSIPYTYKGLDTLEAAQIVTLNTANDHGRNADVKMTMTIWLEGWDADCIDMVLDQTIDINMSFTNYNTIIENDPIYLVYNTTDPETGEIVATKTAHQVVNMQISDDMPAYVEGNTTHKFKGWSLKTFGYDDVMWDFTKPVTPLVDPKINPEAATWTLTSVWE